MKCKICLKDVNNLNRHVSAAHKVKCLDYFIEYENFEIPKCRFCDKQAKHIRQLDFNKTCGNEKCSKLAISHTEETKKHLSNKRKEYLQNNKDKNSWSIYKNQETEPEKRFREVIEKIENIQFYQYYMPEESEKFYEMDFAIKELKIDFEVNGEQHYNRDGSLADYYQERHDYFTNLGWTVVEIHYSLCFDDNKIKEIILNTLNKEVSFSEEICNEAINHRNELKKRKEIQVNQYKQNIINKKIDSVQREMDRFFKIVNLINEYGERIGLINYLCENLNVSHTQVRRILKKYNLDIKLR